MAPKKIPLRGWRKIAVSTWKRPTDPQIYGDLEIDATNLLGYTEEVRASGGPKITVTHLVGKAIAHALHEHPDLNARLYRGGFVRRDSVDVFFIVSAEAGNELSGVKVLEADKKSVAEIAEELSARAGRVRDGDDVEMGKTKKMIGGTPRIFMKSAMKVTAWLTADRDIDLQKYGLPRQAFGSAMVSSVGMFGIGHAYAPLSPFYRIPFLALVGEVQKRPVVIDDEIVARPMFTIAATMDHRYLDGFHAARLARSVRAYLADPKAFESGAI